MIDIPHIAKCPRRLIKQGSLNIIQCKPMPQPLGLSNKDYRDNIDLYHPRIVTIKDCEKCLGRELPSLRTQLKTYVKTVTKWGLKGGKERSDEEVQRIWKICQQCDALQDGKCMECGCPIGLEGLPIKNKLKMDTTHCIRGLW